MPMMPDDSQKCVNSLQNSLTSRNIHIPQPNASCDAVLCFCGIRLHQITSLSCPAAFNITGNYRNATPTAAVRNLEHNCKNSSYAGCTKCLGALQKLKVEGKNGTKEKDDESDRASKMLSRDCQLMGLTWLLARNKTAYIPTVSAVLRAISAHPPTSPRAPRTRRTCPSPLIPYSSRNTIPPLLVTLFHFCPYSFLVFFLPRAP
ncbi:UNVERIFIED_CONTAM: putative GPI-anchored protein [Sesamum latifolium]|uniref:GPI-anchored protein n=1 Tax=Sesamum latifolium TaxID=2727402 RepID=A0AAW2WRS7_9LAMI